MRLILVLAFFAGLAQAQVGPRDPYFRRYPFDEWVQQGPISQVKWQVRIPPALLSPQQRLVQRIQGLIDENEVEKRRDSGELIFFLEIIDAEGRHFRARESANLKQIPPNARSQGFSFAQDIFVLPGTYTVNFVVFDAKTRERSLFRREVKVNPLKNDPLPAMWKDMPSVEFARLYGQPDAYFQPLLRGHIAIPVAAKRPVHIDVVMNMTPTQRVPGSLGAFRRNLALLIPAMRVLSGISAPQSTLDVSVLDLTKRRAWRQKSVERLDWLQMREPFAAANPGVIDAQSLAGKAEMNQFLWDELLDRLKPEETTLQDPIRVVILLSTPVFLEKQTKVEPATYPKDPNRRVYYIQYRPLPPRGFRMMEGAAAPPAMSLPSDDLEHTVKLLDARIFEVISPEQFRKALATIVADIEKM